MRDRTDFLFLNVGHFLDHFFMLIFATVAALALSREWGMSYAELIPYATPGFVAFAVFSLPAGWLADRWNRDGMMVVFFIGIGLSSAATALAQTPLQMAGGLFAIGIFAAIYHPVGIALVIEGRARTGVALGVNGVFGNLGVASAALIAGFMIDNGSWRATFVWPGALSVVLGVAYGVKHFRPAARGRSAERQADAAARPAAESYDRAFLLRVFGIIFFSTAVGGLVFQSTTFSLPKVFDERLGDLGGSATAVGWFAFVVFAIASVGQLIVGFLVDRYAIRFVFIGVAVLQVALFAVMPSLTGWAALAAATIFMLGVFGQIPINDVLVGRVTRSAWRSRVLAARYIVTFSVTAVSVPVIAWIYATGGFDLLFTVLAVAAGLILTAVTMLPALRAPAPVAAE